MQCKKMGTLLYQKSTSGIIKSRALPLSESEISLSIRCATSHVSAQNLSDKLYHLYPIFRTPISTEKTLNSKLQCRSFLSEASQSFLDKNILHINHVEHITSLIS